MTGQAVLRGASLLVTGKTPAHLVRGCAWCGRHLLDLAVTGVALQPVSEVAFMSEIDEIGQTLQTHPGDRILAFPMVQKHLGAGRFGL